MVNSIINERFENSCQIYFLQKQNRELAIQFWEQEYKERFGRLGYMPLDTVAQLFNCNNVPGVISNAFEEWLYSYAHLEKGWSGVLDCAKQFGLQVPDLVMECLCNSCACRECKVNCSGRTCEQCRAEYGSGYHSYCDD